MIKFDSKILSSCYINFLFGAGVNGKAFPQVELFTDTKKFLQEKVPTDSKNESLENMFNLLNGVEQKHSRELFINEFKSKEKTIDYSSDSIKHIKDLLRETYKLVYNSENRIEAMNQINIFTVNYDFIIENCLKELGYLNNYVSASNLISNDKFFNVVGRDYSLKRDIPTFLVSKIHGDIGNPILPGADKYDSVLMPNKFEIVFKMKEKLMRDNSILFVIGYSGRDDHINRILKDCVNAGLTVFWFKYCKEDIVPIEIAEQVTKIENDDKSDTTALYARLMKELWVESSEK